MPECTSINSDGHSKAGYQEHTSKEQSKRVWQPDSKSATEVVDVSYRRLNNDKRPWRARRGSRDDRADPYNEFMVESFSDQSKIPRDRRPLPYPRTI